MNFNFIAKELSIDDGSPIELYEFTYGINHYRYCTAPKAVEYNGLIWNPAAISRQPIILTNNIRKSQLILNVPRDFLVAQLFKTAYPEDHVYVKIYKMHRTDTLKQAIVEWVGRVMTVSWGNFGAQITCESIYSSLERNAKIRRYSLTCPFVLYGANCKVNPENFKVEAVLDSIDGTTLISDDFASKPDSWFLGGYIMVTDANVLFSKRFIVEHTGNKIVIQQPIMGLKHGDIIIAYAGCDHLLETCKNKFNNVENFGGFPWVPERNPFMSNSSIYW